MAAQTEIGWTDSTHNHWLGCTKISPACDNCYAEALMDNRLHRAEWGAGKPRVLTSEANRRKPLQWNRSPFYECEKCGLRTDNPMVAQCIGPHRTQHSWRPARRRVFCSSLADVFDNEVPAEWLADLLDLIRRTPNLDWLLLTKRIGNWRSRLKAALASISGVGETIALRDWIENWLNEIPPNNVQIGATICNQDEANRDVPKLQRVPALVRFVSLEPMLGPINMTQIMRREHGSDWTYCDNALTGFQAHKCGGYENPRYVVHWAITGGETSASARPSNPQWFRDIRDQCAKTGTAYFHKQNGEWVSVSEVEGPGEHYTFADGRTVRRTRKKIAGRMLDGVIHNEFPHNLALR